MKFLYRFLITLLAALPLAACSDELVDDDDGGETQGYSDKTTILVYAVASNNLYSNLVSDKNEIVAAAPYINHNDVNILVFSVIPDTYAEAEQKIERLVRLPGGDYGWETVAEWPYEYDNPGWEYTYATDPARIREVIDKTLETAPAENFGIVFWSHGSAWTPGGTHHDLTEFYSFGQDRFDGISDYTDIDELAACLPDGVIDFVWFDACYMSNIETIYEFRDKCRYFVAYPTEVYIYGAAYEVTMPYLAKAKPDIVGAAKAFFEWYDDRSLAATIGVFDMSKLPELADATRELYSSFRAPSSYSDLICYSRGSLGPYYDFGQVTKRVAAETLPGVSLARFNAALSDFTLYKAAFELDFNNREIPAEHYHGISMHVPGRGTSSQEAFHQSLAWTKYVFP